jgi:hypothetical protein
VPKQSALKSRTSRIRFIMLDAELAEGDLSQITSAVQNALKPATVIQQRLANHRLHLRSPATGAVSEVVTNDTSEEEKGVPEAPEAPRPSREPRVRKPTVPKVLELDLTSGVSLESFVSEHQPKSDPDRNLVVTAWFKEHRGVDSITVAHVYTCYRAMKWPAGIEDFSWPLRYLKKEQLTSSPSRGQYAINHLGLARVQAMGSE